MGALKSFWCNLRTVQNILVGQQKTRQLTSDGHLLELRLSCCKMLKTCPMLKYWKSLNAGLVEKAWKRNIRMSSDVDVVVVVNHCVSWSKIYDGSWHWRIRVKNQECQKILHVTHFSRHLTTLNWS